MAEYIDRNTAIAKVTALEVTYPIATLVDVKRLLADMPAAEVEPVRHGRWINERMLVGGFAEKWGCDCSECGKTIEEPLWKPNYCPNCGTKMDGGDDRG